MDVGLQSKTYVETQVSHTGIHNSEIYQTTCENLKNYIVSLHGRDMLDRIRHWDKIRVVLT